MKSIFRDIVDVFDATFRSSNLEAHYKAHTDPAIANTKLPKGMSKEEYAKKSELVSLKKIDNKNVIAAQYGNRTAKSDNEWFVVYADGKNGEIVSSYPGKHNKVKNTLTSKNAKMIESE